NTFWSDILQQMLLNPQICQAILGITLPFIWKAKLPNRRNKSPVQRADEAPRPAQSAAVFCNIASATRPARIALGFFVSAAPAQGCAPDDDSGQKNQRRGLGNDLD